MDRNQVGLFPAARGDSHFDGLNKEWHRIRKLAGITPEDREGLIPAGVARRHELNEYEQDSIAEARLWAIERKRKPVDVPFCKNLDKRMYNRVWKWAGDNRGRGANIGSDPIQIEQQLYQLVGSTL